MLRRVFCVEQLRGGRIGIDQRAIGVFAVFVSISQQKLAQSDYVSIVDLPFQHIALLLPIDLRLADTIDESKWLDAIEVSAVKPAHLKGIVPERSGATFLEGSEALWWRKEHYEEMGHFGAGAPGPIRWRVGLQVA